MLVGRCHCGAVRFETSAEPVWVGHCHCRDCQLTAGAPVVTWFIVTASEVTISGEPSTYRSSDHASREFCPRCGCLVFFRSDRRSHQVDIVAACLDDPTQVTPTVNIFTRSRIGFMHEFDRELPSHEGNQPG
jgi:hypothetical protein